MGAGVLLVVFIGMFFVVRGLFAAIGIRGN